MRDLNVDQIKKLWILDLITQTGSLIYSLKAVKSRVENTNILLNELKMNSVYKNIIGNAITQLFQQSNRIAEENNIPFTVI